MEHIQAIGFAYLGFRAEDSVNTWHWCYSSSPDRAGDWKSIRNVAQALKSNTVVDRHSFPPHCRHLHASLKKPSAKVCFSPLCQNVLFQRMPDKIEKTVQWWHEGQRGYKCCLPRQPCQMAWELLINTVKWVYILITKMARDGSRSYMHVQPVVSPTRLRIRPAYISKHPHPSRTASSILSRFGVLSLSSQSQTKSIVHNASHILPCRQLRVNQSIILQTTPNISRLLTLPCHSQLRPSRRHILHLDLRRPHKHRLIDILFSWLLCPPLNNTASEHSHPQAAVIGGIANLASYHRA